MLHPCNMSGVVSDKRTDEPTLDKCHDNICGNLNGTGDYINSQLIQQVLHIQDT